MFKRAAILSPYQKQARNLAQERRLADIDEMLAMKARYDALMRQAQARTKAATRPAVNSRAQGRSQQRYSRTKCEACWSTLVTIGQNDLVCLLCKHVSPRWTPVDTNRYPGAYSCKHCGSIDQVVYHERELFCKLCGGVTPRWG